MKNNKLTARTIKSLAAKLTDEWYESIEGVYSGNVPTWGPETEMVKTLIGSSCAEGDIVSWSTRNADPAKHLFLRRSWCPAHLSFQPEHVFAIYTGAELADLFGVEAN